MLLRRVQVPQGMSQVENDKITENEAGITMIFEPSAK